MLNFDDDRPDARPLEERQFQLRGRVFTVRPFVRPETIAIIDDADLAGSSAATLKEMDRGIREFLVPADREAWDEVRADDGDDVVSLLELQAISQRLVRIEAGLPTEAPSGSTDGRKPTAPSSTGTSDSQEETRAV